MISQTFAKLYQKLNSAQKQAVDTVEGAVMVIAGPGTGKTQVLTLRIANILEKTQVNPGNILALTFTESAVYEMRSRLLEIIGNAAYRVEINTFHGFCNDIIQNHPEEFSNRRNAEPITDLEQLQLIQDLLMKGRYKYIKPIGDSDYYIIQTRTAINTLKKENISAGDYLQALEDQKKAIEQAPDLLSTRGASKGKMKAKYSKQLDKLKRSFELAYAFSEYEKALVSLKKYDYNDMLLDVIKIFDIDQNLLAELQERFQYVLVDEHQDTNAAQNTIISRIGESPVNEGNPNLFVVGDEKQAIFRFQGASLENFLFFKKLYPEAVLINLQENYRSSQTILNAAGSLIKNNIRALSGLPPQPELQAKAERTDQQIHVAILNDYFAEYYFIADQIKQRIKNGIPPHEIAVLARKNADLIPLADILAAENILYAMETDRNILNDMEIQKFLLILRAIDQVGTDEQLAKVMHIECFKIYPLDIYRLLQFAYKERKSLWEVIDTQSYKEMLELHNEKAIKKLVTQLNDWKTKSENIRFDDLFVSVLHESCLLEAILKKELVREHLDHITGLFEDIRFQLSRNRNFSLHDFIEYIDSLVLHHLPINSNPKTTGEEAVKLMTAHKSKGLEFDSVFIINAYDSHWSNIRERGTPFLIPWEFLTVQLASEEIDDKNEDERRLFYVALTRARNEVTISYSTQSLEGKTQEPTIFIGEIALPYQEKVVTETFEKEFLSHKDIILTPKKIHAKTKDIYLEHTDYFAELFKRQGLNVSGLNNYLTCPWLYFFKTLLKIPEVKSVQQMLGTAVHAGLNNYITMMQKGNASLEDMLKEFNTAMRKEPFSKTDLPEYTALGESILSEYYRNKSSKWTNKRESELRIYSIRFTDDIFINGTIDMIEHLPKSKDVIVYDFKTGKPKKRYEMDKADGKYANYKRQLVFYKLLLDRYHNGEMRMDTGVIEFVEPDISGTYHSEEFTITEELTTELSSIIKTVAEEIMTLSFWDKTCDDPACEFCQLRKYVL